MIHIAPILTDPELGGTTFSVSRKTYRREMGEVIPSEVEGYTAVGTIQPATSEDLQLFPEEERSEDMIILLSSFHFRLGETGNTTFTTADVITWNGQKYRVVKVKDWSAQGGFHKAWAVRQKERGNAAP